jgi:hypothetical protein
MIDRKLRNLRPKDLFFVLLYGLLLPFVFAIVAGFVDYYISSALPISMGGVLFWIIAIYSGGIVRKQYDEPHLVYAILFGFGLILAAVVLYTVPYVFADVVTAGGSPLAVFNPVNYLPYVLILLNPLYWILGFSIDLLIWLVLIGVGMYQGLHRACQRNY